MRVCSVCKAVLEKKINSLRNTSVTTPIIQMHIKKLLILEIVFLLTTSSGEQKYALESARSMHSDLLQALQKIELLGRQFSKFSEPDSEFYVNRALARLALSVSRRAKHFVQNYLPPLRTLPTLKQYDSLTSQRKDELSARWLEEDRALAELMERVNLSKPNGTDISSGINTTTTTKLWKRLFQQPNSYSNPKGVVVNPQKKKTTIQSLSDIAREIDQVAAQLMIARKEGRLRTADELARKLDQLEQEFQYVSNNLDDDSELLTT
ncbi:unnamed protein product [Trichobilharzia regenti]|nr:unnamed protein product [Trichobilharzia regenti]